MVFYGFIFSAVGVNFVITINLHKVHDTRERDNIEAKKIANSNLQSREDFR